MLPENYVVQQPLPSVSSIMIEPSNNRNATEDYYLFDPYSNRQVLNFTYQPQHIYLNTWQEVPVQNYTYASYPIPSTYEQPLVSTVQQPFQEIPMPLETYNQGYGSENGIGTSSESPVEQKPTTFIPTVRRSRKSPKQTRDVTCSHCSTSETTLWRKNDRGDLECNACNLYYRHNKIKRPLTLCKDKPATRKRRQMKKDNKSEPI